MRIERDSCWLAGLRWGGTKWRLQRRSCGLGQTSSTLCGEGGFPEATARTNLPFGTTFGGQNETEDSIVRFRRRASDGWRCPGGRFGRRARKLREGLRRL